MKTLTLILIFLSAAFTNAQSTLIENEAQKILGTWVTNNEATNKWILTANNTCTWELNGTALDTFTYSVSSEFSPNGVEHTYLKLIKINDPNVVYEYAINSLGDNKMTLETIEPKVSYTHFTKQ